MLTLPTEVAGDTFILNDPLIRTNGAMSFSFTNVPGAQFTVLTSTNVALPLDQWTVLGSATETASGQYQFTDPGATNQPTRFYQVIWP